MVVEEILTPEVTSAIVVLLGAATSYLAYKVEKGDAFQREWRAEECAAATPLIVMDPTTSMQGVWSPEAKEALEKTIPVGAEVIKIDSGPTYHIVYWRVKK